MNRSNSAALCALVAAAALAAAAHAGSVGGFVARRAPAGWTVADRVNADELVNVTFAVKLRNVEALHQTVDEVSDPRHERYGRHLSVDEVNELTGDWESTGRVFAWLLAGGVPADSIRPTRGGDFVFVRAEARTLERVLDAAFYTYVHADGRSVVRSPIYRLPPAIDAVVDFVTVANFPTSRPPRRVRQKIDAALASLTGYVTPAVLQKTYSIDTAPVASDKSTSMVYESLGQSFSPDDLLAYQKQFNLDTSNTVSKVIGPNDPSSCASSQGQDCGEADLDVEVLMGLAQGSPFTFWSMASGSTFLQWITDVAAADDAPLVASISYGDIEEEGDPSTMNRFCDEVSKLAARGLTVLVSSGDDGVANFLARGNATECGFHPSYPASCPHVTAVGATMGPESGNPEVACTSSNGGGITTGGGFSTVFDMPSYQTQAVQSYLSDGPNLPPTSMFNSAGRGYPDIAALGYAYAVEDGGKLVGESGTSASAPAIAAMIVLINGERISQGKPPLGFINPALYQLADSQPGAFNDITSGENNCAAGAPSGQPHAATCCEYGFTAGAGWDPLTGLGSPNYDQLLEAFLAI